ncbi:MAG: twin-arginine translocation signal domain-containing protein, partial [Verrucomicrobia bacterium]|nr:twin-arginine translocation signal domain-containing protein [Verrucomicrobiota bacterium]
MPSPNLSKISRRRFFYYSFAGLAGLTGAGLTRYLPGTSWAAKTEDGIEVEDAVYQGIREQLGKYIYLTPQKLGGGTHAVDLGTQKTLSWISYWNYG